MARIGQKKRLDGDLFNFRLTNKIPLGVLADAVSRDLIEDVPTEINRREQRSRLLPAHVMILFCQAMCLFFDEDYITDPSTERC